MMQSVCAYIGVISFVVGAVALATAVLQRSNDTGDFAMRALLASGAFGIFAAFSYVLGV